MRTEAGQRNRLGGRSLGSTSASAAICGGRGRGGALRMLGTSRRGERGRRKPEEITAPLQGRAERAQHRHARAQPGGEASRKVGQSTILGVAAVAQEYRTEVAPVPNNPPDRLVHSTDRLARVPPPAIAVCTAAVQELLLHHDTQVIPRRIGDAHEHHQAALAVGEIDALAQLAAADCGQDGTPHATWRWRLIQRLAVQLHGLPKLRVPLGLVEERFPLLDLLQDARLAPSLQHLVLLRIGLEGQQEPVGRAGRHGGHRLAQFCRVRRVAPLRERGVETHPSRPRRQHAAPKLLPGVDHVGVLQPHRERHPEGLRGGLHRRQGSRGHDDGAHLLLEDLLEGDGAREAPEAKDPLWPLRTVLAR
mmetsp:Transcript_49940/g.129624  ORF Transcript_49940/g.129624 Transcript_49940/m.129624 type:complete len:363 (-) Transcript_49940:1217-2305(-)